MQINAWTESWPINGLFTVSRGSKSHAHVVVVSIFDGVYTGVAECVPYARYGESVNNVLKQIQSVKDKIKGSTSNEELLDLLPAGAARNALDCALWDLKSKQQEKPLHRLLNTPEPIPYATSLSIGIDTPQNMANKAKAFEDPYILKIKAGSDDDLTRFQAVHKAQPKAKLMIDVNEAWDIDTFNDMVPHLQKLNVCLIEQPFPADNDNALLNIKCDIPLCADESAHTTEDLEKLKGKYSVINIKLDKTGGLTEATRMVQQAQKDGFDIMLGCMVCTSLSIKPIETLTSYAKFTDLDGPLLLEKDRV